MRKVTKASESSTIDAVTTSTSVLMPAIEIHKQALLEKFSQGLFVFGYNGKYSCS